RGCFDVRDEPPRAGDETVRNDARAQRRVRLVVVAHHTRDRPVHAEPGGAVGAYVHPTGGHDLAVSPGDVLEPAGAPDQRLQPAAGLEPVDALEKLRPLVSALAVDKLDKELTPRKGRALHERTPIPNDPFLRVERLEPAFAQPVLERR